MRNLKSNWRYLVTALFLHAFMWKTGVSQTAGTPQFGQFDFWSEGQLFDRDQSIVQLDSVVIGSETQPIALENTFSVPATVAPTVAPATVAPATVAPATVAPATVAPATVAPASVAPASDPIVSNGTAEIVTSSDAESDTDTDANTDTDAETDIEEEVVVLDFHQRHHLYQSRYRTDTGSTTWLPGSGDDLGWISMHSTAALEEDDKFGITFGSAIHWLSGPSQTDLPPRVYDIVWGIQWADEVGPFFAYDIAANFGIFADFKDSVRQGIQYPGHAVGYLRASPRFQLVFGVDYLGQDDIKILPVFGMHFKTLRPIVDAELVFPKPRISFILNAENKLFVAGNIGGGTWDIERPDESNDVFTYRDHRVAIGLETLDEDDGSRSTIEFGMSFNRELTFRHHPLEMDLDQAFFIRFVTLN